MNIISIANYVIYGIVALLALIGFLFGIKRGFFAQGVRLVTIILSIVAAFLLTTLAYSKVMDYLNGKTLGELLAQFGVAIEGDAAAWAECFEMETAAYIATIPLTLIVLPFAFVILFFVISFILWIVFMILARVFGFTKENNNGVTRLVGALVGIVQGVVVAGVILLPITGTLSVVEESVAAAEEKHAESQNAIVLGDMCENYIEPINKNIALTVYNKTHRFMYDAFLKVDIEQTEVSMRDVATDSVELFVLYGDLSGIEMSNLSAEHKLVIDNMIDTFSSDVYMSTIFAGTLRAVARAEENGLLSLGGGEEGEGNGEGEAAEEDVMGSFLGSLISVFKTGDHTTVKPDFTTIKNIYYILSDSGTLVALTAENVDFEEVFGALAALDENGKSTLGKITAELKSNSRTAPIATELNNFAMQIALQNAGITDPDVAQTVENVKNDLNEVIAMNREDYSSDEEYKGAVSDKIGETLAENQIEITEEQLDQVSDFVIEEFDDIDEITDAEIADFMAKYYDAYLNAESGDLGDIGDIEDLGDLEGVLQ